MLYGNKEGIFARICKKKIRFFKVFVDQKIGFRCGSFSGTKNKLFFETCDGMFVGKYG